MLLKVFLRIVVASIAVSPLLLGFFFSFRILLTRETIGWFQLFAMVVSDSDYEQLMDEDRGDFYEIVAYLFFSAFILLVIIVVLNLLIGLAVSDVDVSGLDFVTRLILFL
jgi:predicted transcriptional regulator